MTHGDACDAYSKTFLNEGFTRELLKSDVTSVTKRHEDKIPTITARRIKRGDGVELFAFICPKCGQHITHGAAGGAGHRLAHCPCYPRGYYITEDGR